MAIVGTVETVEQIVQALRANQDDRRRLERLLADATLKENSNDKV